jgi:hypothetical protein
VNLLDVQRLLSRCSAEGICRFAGDGIHAEGCVSYEAVASVSSAPSPTSNHIRCYPAAELRLVSLAGAKMIAVSFPHLHRL